MGGQIQADTITNSAGTGAPSFPFGFTGSGLIPNYFTGYMLQGWSTTSSTFVDLSPSGANTLVTLVQNGLTVTAAGSNLPGITFSPNKAGAIYLMSMVFGTTSNTSGAEFEAQMTDGATPIAYNSMQQNTTTNNVIPMTLQGIYISVSTSPVTIKVQGRTTAGSFNITNAVGASPLESINFMVLQLF